VLGGVGGVGGGVGGVVVSVGGVVGGVVGVVGGVLGGVLGSGQMDRRKLLPRLCGRRPMTTRRKSDADLIRYREIGLTEAQWAKINAEAARRGITQQVIFREMVAKRVFKAANRV
jgi:hypothetical protein